MSGSQPLVSIGMPVYNGGKYLAQALESLLAQEYKNFELIVCDNNSTDNTHDICKEFAREDDRISYHRNKSNIGAIANFNQVYELSQGEYFMWAAHDDLWENSYISKCVEALMNGGNAVLACTLLDLIDDNGRKTPLTSNNFDTRSLNSCARMQKVASRTGWYEIYGLIEKSALQRTSLMKNVWGHDVVLLMELSSLGSFILVPEVLFHYRFDPKKSIATRVNGLQLNDEVRVRPNTTLLFELIRSISNSRIHFIQKWSCGIKMVLSYYRKRKTLIGQESAVWFYEMHRVKNTSGARRAAIAFLALEPASRLNYGVWVNIIEVVIGFKLANILRNIKRRLFKLLG